MIPIRISILFSAWLLGTSALFLPGCSRSEAKSDESLNTAEQQSKPGSQDETVSSEQETSYKEGEGLLLSKSAEQAMNIKVAKVSTQNLAKNLAITVQVYREAGEATYPTTQEKKGFAYATANVAADLAHDWKAGRVLKSDSKAGEVAVVERIDNSLSNITGRPEIIVRLEDPRGQLKICQTLSLFAEAGNVSDLAVPAEAILSNTEGSFVYRSTGTSFLKTPVTLGAQDMDFVQIKAGLAPDDLVVTKPVNRLWLLELHFTKAGAD